MKKTILIISFSITVLTLRAQITDTGDEIGIGTTSPNQKLDVKGNIALDNYLILSQGGSSIGFGGAGIGNEDDDITIDIANDGELELMRGGVNLLSIGSYIQIDRNNTRNIGIGTSTPSQKLDIKGNIALDNYSILSQGGSFVSFGGGGIGNEDDDIGISIANDGELEVHRNGVNVLSIGNQILLDRTNSRNVGIGIENPKSKLAVNGQIRATEVKVLADINVPDYVFEPDYELRTLKETKEYIEENKHLPEIPSAAEIGENGIDLGDMNMRLLKKIEELTLYQIELLEKLEQQNEQLQEQQKRIEKLENE